jgi:EpsI family protein
VGTDRVAHAKAGARIQLRGALEAALVALLVATGAFAWALRLRTPLEVDVAPLARFPASLGPFRAEEIPLGSAVEEELRADFNLLRSYAGPDRLPVVLYIGYYGTARGGRPEHSPRGCYTGAGYGIESARIVDLGEPRALRANEWIVEREGVRELVIYWFRSHRRTGMTGGFDASIDKLLGRLVDGRADGALVRVSTPLPAHDGEAARTRLRRFAAAVDAELDAHWPMERPQAG